MTRIGPIAADRPSEKSDYPSESQNAGFQTACVFCLTGNSMMVVMIVPAFRPASGFPFYQRNDELARFGRFACNKVCAVKPHYISLFQFVFLAVVQFENHAPPAHGQ